MYIRSASQLHLFAKPWDLKYLFVIHLLLMLGWWRNVRETWVARAWFSRLQSQTLCPFSMFKDENHLVQFDEFLQWFWNSKITRQIELVWLFCLWVITVAVWRILWRREALEVWWIQLYSCVDNNATFNRRFSNNTLFGKSVLMIWSLMNTYSSGSGATICTMNIVA